MRSRVLTGMLAALAAMFFFTSCDDILGDMFGGSGSASGGRGGELTDFRFGYETRQTRLEKILGIKEKVFRSFTSEEEFLRIQDIGTLEDDYLRNRYEYERMPFVFSVETSPRKARVDELLVESSDTTVIKVLGGSEDGVALMTVGFGEVDLRVVVRSGRQEVAKVYPMAVVGTTDLNFYITPYWLGGVNTRIRYKVKGLPENISALMMEVKDSVTVIGECAYFNHFLHGSVPQVIRDTVRYPLHRRMDIFHKGHRVLVRNITPAVRMYRNATVPGTHIRVENGRRDTVWVDYEFKVEQVVLTMAFVTDNPYLEFLINSKCGRTTDSLVDGGSDDDEIDGDDSSESDGPDVETFNYFTININDFLSTHQKDSIRNEIEGLKRRTGFIDGATDEQKQRVLDEINRILDEMDEDD